ncbi:hypothetical protein [Paraburkholderia sediminicola]|uniref:hypothetical protein n=1 Tax=Paraburkholderia sediminicola TaxID=458836 RepID=UPI0038BAE7A3
MKYFQFRARFKPALATDAINSTQRYRLEVGGARAKCCAAVRAFDFHHGHQEFLASGQPPFVPPHLLRSQALLKLRIESVNPLPDATHTGRTV